MGVQVLVDADNLDVARLTLVALALAGAPDDARVVVSGRPERLAAVTWPSGAQLRPATGWQSADLVLALAYAPDREPLVLVSGDGDFVHLASRHTGPVLVVAARSSRSSRHAEGVSSTDPATEGTGVLVRWLARSTG